ncbi:hypothetical protein A2W13_01610 [Candidatus Woesebacteria bacterium RBG_16_36_11]|uniref:HTH cro/C1-type domain-containing protein n=3 Tax=Candidatus Woeseibacteriota TaxID=1752722 RepID=A0A1F7XBC6_9BACT|nr:MAG: hypothetical protein A2Z67_03620 [Candidatus Woesebacteria bacterium RBG_13_36_22]OGM12322.1 MAG: hypothetical protein A2W13_01610 [Candidatus Woesebacteria bacterium RBG_16_36_11]OGM17259.1 MAG: hypothetical protein A2V55_01820 [Candidatus Woesebacteria bacterium RBG_19FT_COMBO_37_29]
MKTIGEVLREARSKKRYSLESLEKETKIKKSFIQAIEKENWDALPEYPVILGFVKNIASFLGIDTKGTVALLRRDYPPKVLSVNPKPDISREFSWSPKLTFLVGIGVVILLISGYLGFQYIKFISPPTLQVVSPKESQVVDKAHVFVQGKTDAEATVKVNNQPVLVGEDGNFSLDLDISQKTEEVDVISTSRSGKISEIKVKIIPKFD